MDVDNVPPPATDAATRAVPATTAEKKNSRWLVWALTSGGFAAFNGVFAKLTTTDHTSDLAASISHVLGASDSNKFVEILLRGTFFGLNLLSNAIMWILFTRALTAATSTTQVSILNTSANFLVTAIMGLIIFGEELPLGWWAGAALLVSGSVVIGAREEKARDESTGQQAEGEIALQDEPTEDGDRASRTRTKASTTKRYRDERNAGDDDSSERSDREE